MTSDVLSSCCPAQSVHVLVCPLVSFLASTRLWAGPDTIADPYHAGRSGGIADISRDVLRRSATC